MAKANALERLIVNLSREQVHLVLLAVAARLDSGFSRDDAEEFCAQLDELEPDDELVVEPAVSFRRATFPFGIEVAKTGADSFAVGVVGPAAAIDMVEAEIRGGLIGAGVRRMRAARS